jgi:hypothetical protein
MLDDVGYILNLFAADFLQPQPLLLLAAKTQITV